MLSKTIGVTNVKQSVNGQWIEYKPGDTPIKGERGYSLQVGFKNGDDWENYFCNDVQLFDQFVKGTQVVVEYEVRKSKAGRENNIILGVGGSAPAPGGTPDAFAANNGARNDSIEKQTHVKAWATIYGGCELVPTPAEFAANVLASWENVHHPPKPKTEDLVEHVAAAQAELDATVSDAVDEPDSDIPF